MVRLLTLILGIIITTICSVYIILYLNLLSFGYKFNEYVNFIIRRYECNLILLGFILIILALSFERKPNDELCK